MSRVIEQIVESREQDEGVGARVRRSIGTSRLKNLDPFLMLDEFKVKKPAGFPDHPHRGFETVTYMLSGSFRHEDFCGHKGIINPGDLQWMTAGRGIVHCEMPEGDDLGHGLQLWVNLSKANKMTQPAYQELLDKDIPRTTKDGVTVKVIAGESLGIKSPVYTRTPTMYLDFKLEKGATLNQRVPEGWNGFVYVLSGTALFGPDDKAKKGPAHHTLVMGQGNSLRVKNDGDKTCHFVLIAGQPLNEPIVQYGTWVMNTEQEIQQTEHDYMQQQNGFEGAHSWNSWLAYQ
ncbi:pirin-like isoform X2 [Dreissena polymorpha]|uniref:pirin-like isoform X2 n=1 Tax=Dreissena polymorpha TaxID=45954 RepID=UPI002263F547|nr:pirin-like isoform X2 [Dreissena polymorpha]XP_052281550.1 pirin-like isoform X2 [Dreissena polymorpha]